MVTREIAFLCFLNGTLSIVVAAAVFEVQTNARYGRIPWLFTLAIIIAFGVIVYFDVFRHAKE